MTNKKKTDTIIDERLDKKRIMELNANNVIIFPLRDEDVERRRRNAEIDKELEENTEEEDDAGKRE